MPNPRSAITALQQTLELSQDAAGQSLAASRRRQGHVVRDGEMAERENSRSAAPGVSPVGAASDGPCGAGEPMGPDTRGMNMLKALVIGGGIHGVASALLLSKKGLGVTLLEKKEDLLCGVSGATHGRAHIGYHYPRSIETALECQQGLRYFQEYYPKALVYPSTGLYAIAKEESKTTVGGFKEFCRAMGLPILRPAYCAMEDGLLCMERLSACFTCFETVYDVQWMRARLWRELAEQDVRVETESEVAVVHKDDRFTLITKELQRHEADIVVNATYTETNRILKFFGQPLIPYRLQTTEVVMVLGPDQFRDLPSMTILDGPFCSILPQPREQGIYLAYHVIHSVVNEECGVFYTPPSPKVSNWPEIQEGLAVFFPFAEDLTKVRSLWGSRPIPQDVEGDSRQTRVMSHSRGLYSILEGKFISAFTAAEKVWKLIQEQWFF